MERIKIFLIAIVFSLCISPCYAETTMNKMATSTDCLKTYQISYDKLYYLTLSALNQENLKIKEMQTKSGFITFADKNNKVYLASIIYVSSTKSILKITPCDNIYNFTTTALENIFMYIELNLTN
jgi:hypothetical protein